MNSKALPLDVYIGIVAFAAIACHFVYSRWLNPKRRLPLPPGPTRLPLVGNIHQIPLEYPQKTFSDWARKYGNVIYAQLFQKPVVILNTLQGAQDLMEKRGVKYSDRPHFVLLNEFLVPKSNLVLMPFGDKWRRHRKWFQSTMETKSALETYVPLQIREINKLMSELIQKPDGFINHIKRFAGSLMLEIAYGHHVNSVEDEFMVFADQTIAQTAESGSLVATLVDFFPVLRYIPIWMPGGGFKKQAYAVAAMVRKMIDDPFRRVCVAMKSGTAKPSFTTYLIDETSRDGQLSQEDEDDIKGSASIMYGAGTDTTVTSMVTFVLAMVLHPEVFQKAQAEMDRVMGVGKVPQLEDKESLPYLDCVVKEVYRWNPPVPLGVPRRLMENDEYQGYLVPSGSMIIPNLWSMGRDTSIYPEPEKFRPERFEEMDATTASMSDPRKFIFGLGRRICPGRFLADSNVWLAAANMVATLDIRKARDSFGQEITPVPRFKSGSVSHPEHFLCDIRPRTQAIVDMVAERTSEHIG